MKCKNGFYWRGHLFLNRFVGLQVASVCVCVGNLLHTLLNLVLFLKKANKGGPRPLPLQAEYTSQNWEILNDEIWEFNKKIIKI